MFGRESADRADRGGAAEPVHGDRGAVCAVLAAVGRIFFVLCDNYGVWRWSILSRFWRMLGVLVFGMSVCCPCQFGTDLALVE